jgi:hypothetical protein
MFFERQRAPIVDALQGTAVQDSACERCGRDRQNSHTKELLAETQPEGTYGLKHDGAVRPGLMTGSRQGLCHHAMSIIAVTLHASISQHDYAGAPERLRFILE